MPGFVLQGVRALNVNGAAVHVIALDTPAEDAAYLRRLAEENRGTYVARPLSNERNDGKEIVGTYERRYTSWRTSLVNELSRKREQSFREARLTIGGQQRILMVMLEEQDETKAVGPHIVPANPGVGDARQPKFPPSVVPLEPGTLPMPASRAPSPKPKRKLKPAKPKVTERAPSAQRQPSADRAAGGPRAQPKLKPPPRKAAPPPAAPAPAPPSVERRWSF